MVLGSGQALSSRAGLRALCTRTRALVFHSGTVEPRIYDPGRSGGRRPCPIPRVILPSSVCADAWVSCPVVRCNLLPLSNSDSLFTSVRAFIFERGEISIANPYLSCTVTPTLYLFLSPLSRPCHSIYKHPCATLTDTTYVADRPTPQT